MTVNETLLRDQRDVLCILSRTVVTQSTIEVGGESASITMPKSYGYVIKDKRVAGELVDAVKKQFPDVTKVDLLTA